MSETRRIAILLDRSLSFVRDVLQGVRAYAVARPNWVLRDGPPRGRIVSHLREWRPHGIIAGLVMRRVAGELMRMNKPLVDTASTLPGLDVPTVDVDHSTAGRLAAEYLLERRFRGVLGRSVLEEIHRVRVERVKELLTETHLPIETVAVRSGFSSARRLDVVFAKQTGISPTAYRRQSQARRQVEHGG